MDQKKTIFHYLAQVLTVFGFAMLVLNIFCLILGNDARDFSSMFALGDQGVPAGIAFQFLLVSAMIVGLRLIFFTDVLIKKMPIWLRTVCMLASVLAVIAAFIAVFRWFPVNMWQPWVLFFVCFGVSFLGSWLIMAIKEKQENLQMEQALRRLQEKESMRNE